MCPNLSTPRRHWGHRWSPVTGSFAPPSFSLPQQVWHNVEWRQGIATTAREFDMQTVHARSGVRSASSSLSSTSGWDVSNTVARACASCRTGTCSGFVRTTSPPPLLTTVTPPRAKNKSGASRPAGGGRASRLAGSPGCDSRTTLPWPVVDTRAPRMPQSFPDTMQSSPAMVHPFPFTYDLFPVTVHMSPVTVHPSPVTMHLFPCTYAPFPVTVHLCPKTEHPFPTTTASSSLTTSPLPANDFPAPDQHRPRSLFTTISPTALTTVPATILMLEKAIRLVFLKMHTARRLFRFEFL